MNFTGNWKCVKAENDHALFTRMGELDNGHIIIKLNCFNINFVRGQLASSYVNLLNCYKKRTYIIPKQVAAMVLTCHMRTIKNKQDDRLQLLQGVYYYNYYKVQLQLLQGCSNEFPKEG